MKYVTACLLSPADTDAKHRAASAPDYQSCDCCRKADTWACGRWHWMQRLILVVCRVWWLWGMPMTGVTVTWRPGDLRLGQLPNSLKISGTSQWDMPT
jgi:hypothetical protein